MFGKKDSKRLAKAIINSCSKFVGVDDDDDVVVVEGAGLWECLSSKAGFFDIIWF